MTTTLAFCARHGGALLALGIFLGIAVPPLAALCRDALAPVLALLMTCVLMRVDPARLLGWLRRPVLVALLLGWLLLAAPLIAWALVTVLGVPAPLGPALVVMASGCAATSAPAFARLVGLDAEVALIVAVLSTVLVPFTAPPLAIGLLGLDLAIPVGALMGRLALVVGVPLVAATLLRRRLGEARLAALAPRVDGVVVLLMMLCGFGVMDGMQATLRSDPAWVAGALALAFLGNLAMNAATALAFLPAGRAAALSAGLLAGNRNLILFVAVLPPATEPRLLLFLALCQVPLFLNPLLLRPAYRRLRPA